VRTRLLAGALLVAVSLLDLVGAHGTAALVLVAAVPTAAGAALLSLGAALERGHAVAWAHAWLGGIALLLALSAAVLRTPLASTDDVPPLAASALTGCLAILSLQLLVGVVAALRRQDEPQVAAATL
jgi:hypothetical protein